MGDNNYKFKQSSNVVQYTFCDVIFVYLKKFNGLYVYP